MTSGPPDIFGLDLDAASRCRHWHSPLDIVAMRFKCCGKFFACADCHEALAGHSIERWTPADTEQVVARCGQCGLCMTLSGYLTCDDSCPGCRAPFNPGCRKHRGIYFEPDISG
jgi:uncharacterized CHY-type Zn-finger protein